MQYSFLAIAALATAVSANYSVNGTAPASAVWVTDIVTDFTTFCPASTTFSAYGQTYTVTEATTVVLPCPCTSSYLVTPTSAVAIPTVAPVYVNSTMPVASSVAPVTSVAPVYSVTAVGTGSSPAASASGVAPTTSAFTGAGNSMAAPAGALAGVLGLAAYFL